MRRALVIPLLCLGLVGAACRTDTVEIAYRLDAENVQSYRMNARAEATWDIGGPGSGSYEVEFEVTEAVRSVDETGAVVAVVMTPISVEEKGLPSPGPEERSFTLRVGPGGEVLEVLEVDGVVAEALEPEELAFIGTYRPPLPTRRVRLLDTWTSDQVLSSGSVFQQVAATGQLIALDVDGGDPIAELSFEGEGPLGWTTTLPQGEAELTGTASTTNLAEMDIDEGHLNSSASVTSGSFDVRIAPGGKQVPITGTLHLDLHLELRRV
jgi:hypothetical protein